MGDFKLQLEPAERIVFAGKQLGEIPTLTSIKITNTLKERIAFKVRQEHVASLSSLDAASLITLHNELFAARLGRYRVPVVPKGSSGY
ncbi:hypothetical protein KIN20_022134 [Parelaphostrongylus tenuis]|uniref:Uncharacterized protein n=1 Tax=Parelaphostrongylus tenuis TaxID=148309 RepID=A0AAD5MTM3_PARTN|nr:hypothetical protein KIN20_022134 [Parelaphostrongylus tenuis]